MEKEMLRSEQKIENTNKIELLVISQGGKLIKMNP